MRPVLVAMLVELGAGMAVLQPSLWLLAVVKGKNPAAPPVTTDE